MNPARHALILALALAACAAPSTYWEKPGATAEMVQQDNDQCLANARSNSPQPALYGQTGTQTTRVLTLEEQRERSEVESFQKCMREKGYSAKR
ncbi:MAG TPA: hypothetical protein VFX94_00600 [Burkholderiales bacterium]|jgi:hypothetical protein|nr:hypothetical protein [Burkholderiales bacterium]